MLCRKHGVGRRGGGEAGLGPAERRRPACAAGLTYHGFLQPASWVPTCANSCGAAPATSISRRWAAGPGKGAEHCDELAAARQGARKAGMPNLMCLATHSLVLSLHLHTFLAALCLLHGRAQHLGRQQRGCEARHQHTSEFGHRALGAHALQHVFAGCNGDELIASHETCTNAQADLHKPTLSSIPLPKLATF